MNIFVMNEKFELILLVEKYQSFIWNDRYNEYGDFELYLPAAVYNTSMFKIGNYVCCTLSDRTMIIETVICQTGDESGDYLTISGRSLDSLLKRRVVHEQTDLDCGLQEGIERLLNENVISPINVKRKIQEFKFKKSEDSRITSINIKTQVAVGDNLYDVISEIIKKEKVGMKTIKNDLNEFVFELYIGTDRSYAQQTNPWVVFSPDYDNLISSKYTESITEYKNYAIVSSTYDSRDETSADSKEITLEVGKSSGLNMYETYVSASDIISRTFDNDNNETRLTEEEFRQRMIDKGNETLEKYKKEINYETEVDYLRTFKMNEDYFLGDILQVENQYGIKGSLRVNEYIVSVSDSGIEHYPVFVNPDKEDDQNEL